MMHGEDTTTPDVLLAPTGQISDEDLEAVTGGLARPLGRNLVDLQGVDGDSGAGHDDANND
jgi:hypothetical protein